MIRLLEAQKYATPMDLKKLRPWSPSGSAVLLRKKKNQTQWEAGRENTVQKKIDI